MASCVITISGTSGEVLIKYKLSGVNHTMTGGFGQTIYINDTATDIYWKTVSGDAAAASGCVTITELTYTCYQIDWESYNFIQTTPPFSLKFDSVYLDNTQITITSSDVNRYTLDGLAATINDLDDDRVKAVAGKVSQSNRNTFNYSLILKVEDPYEPSLRIINSDVSLPRDDQFLYIKGATALSCLPVDYTEFTYCETTPL